MKVASGEDVGPYELLEPLGAGGMGEVWRARDSRLRRDVAIKFLTEALSADPGAVSRFEREARAAAALAHPGILAVHDVGTHRGRPYLVSELLRGRTLRERLADGPLPLAQALRLGGEVARSLGAAHRAGIVHRDLKPENLFLTDEGGVKILDFGLATVATPDAGSLATFRTASGAVVGTLGYLAPEQLRGEPMGPPADLFGLGCVLHECLTGAPLYRRESVAETLQAIASEPPPLLRLTPAGAAAGLETWIARCLDKDPARRPTAAALAAALESSVSAADTVIESLAGLSRPTRRRPAAWAIVAAAVVLAVSAIWFVSGRRGERAEATPPASTAGDVGTAPAAAAAPADRGTRDDEAWELFVRARHAWEQRGDGILEALDLYRRAVDADPAFAGAWLGVAETYAILHDYAPVPPGETFPKAKAAARRARELDPSLAGAFTVEAYVLSHFDRQYAEAERAYLRALELAPRDAKTLQWYAELLAARGRFDESYARFAQAREADPLAPMALASEVWVRMLAGEPDAGIALADRGELDFPGLGPLKAYRALCRLARGETARAVEELTALDGERISPVVSLWLAFALARDGRAEEADRMLAATIAAHGEESLNIYYRAWIHLARGRSAAALKAIQSSIDRREEQATWILVDPNLAELRGEPRLDELVRAAGFDPREQRQR